MFGPRAKGNKYVSPLYETTWRRVIVDEVQEVEAQATLAAKMLRGLRLETIGMSELHSTVIFSFVRTEQKWGVSGTPVTKGLDALLGLAQFLSITPYCEPDFWHTKIITPLASRCALCMHICDGTPPLTLAGPVERTP